MQQFQGTTSHALRITEPTQQFQGTTSHHRGQERNDEDGDHQDIENMQMVLISAKRPSELIWKSLDHFTFVAHMLHHMHGESSPDGALVLSASVSLQRSSFRALRKI
jgi:hypothetical protein